MLSTRNWLKAISFTKFQALSRLVVDASVGAYTRSIAHLSQSSVSSSSHCPGLGVIKCGIFEI